MRNLPNRRLRRAIWQRWAAYDLVVGAFKGCQKVGIAIFCSDAGSASFRTDLAFLSIQKHFKHLNFYFRNPCIPKL